MILGIGIGILVTLLLTAPIYEKKYTNEKIEKEARKLGMVFPDEIKAYD